MVDIVNINEIIENIGNHTSEEIINSDFSEKDKLHGVIERFVFKSDAKNAETVKASENEYKKNHGGVLKADQEKLKKLVNFANSIMTYLESKVN